MKSVRALANVFHPIRMNYQILGNKSPHLHVYLQPRFYSDTEPSWPIGPFKDRVYPLVSEYQERVYVIRKTLIDFM